MQEHEPYEDQANMCIEDVEYFPQFMVMYKYGKSIYNVLINNPYGLYMYIRILNGYIYNMGNNIVQKDIDQHLQQTQHNQIIYHHYLGTIHLISQIYFTKSIDIQQHQIPLLLKELHYRKNFAQHNLASLKAFIIRQTSLCGTIFKTELFYHYHPLALTKQNKISNWGKIWLGVARAMQYLQSKDVYHGNLCEYTIHLLQNKHPVVYDIGLFMSPQSYYSPSQYLQYYSKDIFGFFNTILSVEYKVNILFDKKGNVDKHFTQTILFNQFRAKKMIIRGRWKQIVDWVKKRYFNQIKTFIPPQPKINFLQTQQIQGEQQEQLRKALVHTKYLKKLVDKI